MEQCILFSWFIKYTIKKNKYIYGRWLLHRTLYSKHLHPYDNSVSNERTCPVITPKFRQNYSPTENVKLRISKKIGDSLFSHRTLQVLTAVVTTTPTIRFGRRCLKWYVFHLSSQVRPTRSACPVLFECSYRAHITHFLKGCHIRRNTIDFKPRVPVRKDFSRWRNVSDFKF